MRVFTQAFSRPRIIFVTTAALLFAWYALFLLHPIDLVRGDIGRHIKNGELIVSSLPDWGRVNAILHTNFYSADYAAFPFINHHWGSGALFYAVYAVGGFIGLQLFFAGVSIATLVLFFVLSKQRARISAVFLGGLFLVPLIAERTEIRPEAFSYLFAAVFLLCLASYQSGRLSARALLCILIPIQILWVNLHVYFFLGPFCVALCLAADYLYGNGGRRRPLLFLFFGTLAASVANPSGIAGALYPLSIFRNYGFLIQENLPVPAILRSHPQFANGYIFYVAFLGVIATSLALWVRKRREAFVFCVLSLLFGVLAFRSARNLTLFALFALPVFSMGLSTMFEKMSLAWKRGVAALVIIFTLFLNRDQMPAAFRSLGFGAFSDIEAAGEFMRDNGIAGPLFNDFDIGSYAIFYLFPSVRPFADNRPEAYPALFFSNEYIPMQTDEAVWKEKEAEHGFTAILYSFEDRAPWALPFIVRRLQDPSWAPVFANNFAIVFLKRIPQNESVIRKFELPKSKFELESS